MFAIFLHESMNTFHQIATSLPTVFFTVIIIVTMIFWLFAVLGFLDLEMLDFDSDIDLNDSIDTPTGFAGILLKFGLNGVPLTVVVSLIGVFGWLISYSLSFLAITIIPDIFIVFIKPIIFIIAFYFGTMLTALTIKPLRKLFKAANAFDEKHIIGQTLIVRSGEVTSTRGEATFCEGGADLLLNIRSTQNEVFKKGDEVVPIEQLGDANLYRVISKREFTD